MSQRSTNDPVITLPKVLAIGFTGHRALADECGFRELIYEFLEKHKVSASGPVYGISSVAAGGDLLFAESCVQLSLPLRILLPLPLEEFRKDFDDASWSRAEEVLKQAASVETVRASRSREESYYECGVETAQQCRILLALWNGKPSQGLGGTGDIVSLAKSLGKPVVWLHSTTGAVEIFNEKSDEELLNDPELDFLNGLPDSPRPSDAEGPENLVWAWFRKIDQSADRFAPQVRRLATIPIVCTAAAALFTGAGSWARDAGIWLTIGTVLGLMATVLPVVLQLSRRQIMWVRTRTTAEVCRSALAFWSTPSPYEAIGPEMVPELSGVLVSLNFLKMRDRARSEAPIEEFKREYSQKRVAGQITYFAEHAARSAKAARRYRTAVWTLIALAVAMNLCLFAVTREMRSQVGQWKPALALVASIVFQLATVTGALLVVNDCDRRKQRYRELHLQLAKWNVELAALRTWPAVLRLAERIERALLAELIEWRSLIRNHRLAKK